VGGRVLFLSESLRGRALRFLEARVLVRLERDAGIGEESVRDA